MFEEASGKQKVWKSRIQMCIEKDPPYNSDMHGMIHPNPDIQGMIPPNPDMHGMIHPIGNSSQYYREPNIVLTPNPLSSLEELNILGKWGWEWAKPIKIEENEQKLIKNPGGGG